MLALRAQHLEPHRGCLIVDGCRVGLHLEARPRPAGGVRLPEGVVGSAAGELDGVQARRAHCIGGGSGAARSGCSRRPRRRAQDRPPRLSWFAWGLLVERDAPSAEQEPAAILQLQCACALALRATNQGRGARRSSIAARTKTCGFAGIPTSVKPSSDIWIAPPLTIMRNEGSAFLSILASTPATAMKPSYDNGLAKTCT